MKMITCSDCMFDAPYWYCCRLECGEHDFCRNCNAECSRQGEQCPRKEMDENIVIKKEV